MSDEWAQARGYVGQQPTAFHLSAAAPPNQACCTDRRWSMAAADMLETLTERACRDLSPKSVASGSSSSLAK